MFVLAARYDDLAEGGVIAVKLEGLEIALCKVDGTVYAISRRCGHLNAPLNNGTLFGHIITCPLHFAQFDVRTGKALLGVGTRSYGRTDVKVDDASVPFHAVTKDLMTYPVKVEDGHILIEIGPVR